MYIRNLFIVTCGLYIGKYYPQYVPIPKINQENLDKLLKYIRDLEKKV